MSYQLSISECCCASLYGKLYIKMLEALYKDVGSE